MYNSENLRTVSGLIYGAGWTIVKSLTCDGNTINFQGVTTIGTEYKLKAYVYNETNI